MEKRFLVDNVKYDEDTGKYQRWDRLDEHGDYFYDNRKFIGYHENNIVEKIPLPENVYHAIIFAEKDSKCFTAENGEYIFGESDYIDCGYLKSVKGSRFIPPLDNEPYFFFVFYEYSDLQYALDEYYEFENKRKSVC